MIRSFKFITKGTYKVTTTWWSMVIGEHHNFTSPIKNKNSQLLKHPDFMIVLVALSMKPSLRFDHNICLTLKAVHGSTIEDPIHWTGDPI